MQYRYLFSAQSKLRIANYHLLQQRMVFVDGGPDDDADEKDDEDDRDDKSDKVLMMVMMMMLVSVIKVLLLWDGRKTMRKVTSCKIPCFVFVTSCNMLLMMVKMIV